MPSTVPGRLLSSAINKTMLQPEEVVLKNNAKVVGKERKTKTLALILARECYFGEDIMIQCTAQGHGDRPGLPLNELMLLKEQIRITPPQFWSAPYEIEQVWSKCLEPTSQGCKRIRDKRREIPPFTSANNSNTATLESYV